MLTSTFLTLLVIPVVYTVFSDMSKKLFGKKASVVASHPAESATVVPMAK